MSTIVNSDTNVNRGLSVDLENITV